MISWFEKHNKISWIITIIGAIAIFYVSSLSFGSGGTGLNLKATLYHIFAFFLFAFFLLISLIKGQRKQLVFIAGILIAVIYCISDEIHQFFVPGRSASVFDVFLDSIGILSASVIYLNSVNNNHRVQINDKP